MISAVFCLAIYCRLQRSSRIGDRYGWRLRTVTVRAQAGAYAITERIDEIDMSEQYVKEFVSKAKEYIEMPKLTPELLRVFIRCIEVYEKEEKYSRTIGNPIVIYYTFEFPQQKTAAATQTAAENFKSKTAQFTA